MTYEPELEDKLDRANRRKAKTGPIGASPPQEKPSPKDLRKLEQQRAQRKAELAGPPSKPPVTPDARVKQREDALARAQEIRLAKARLKRSWADRAQSEVLREIAGLLDDENSTALDSFKLVELMTSVSGIGKSKAKLIAQSAEWLELTRRVGGLTARQRGLLARALRQRADEVEARVQAA